MTDYSLGDDKTLRVWSLETNKLVTQIDLPNPAKTITFSPNGQLIVVGLTNFPVDKVSYFVSRVIF